MKNTLYFLAFLCFCIALYYGVQWKLTNEGTFEPPVSLASTLTAFILFIIAWRYEGKDSADTASTQTNLVSSENKNTNTGEKKGRTRQWNFFSSKNINENV